MKLSGFSEILHSMFTDTMSIRRYIDVENEDKTTETVLSNTPIYEGVKCRISFESRESPQDNEVDDTPIKSMPKIFCATNIDLKEGDLITVQRIGDKGEVLGEYFGKVGLPAMYVTHQEALFYLNRSA